MGFLLKPFKKSFLCLFPEARKNTDSALKYIPVYNADGTGVNRYVDYTTRTFCISLTNIPSVNALSDVYMQVTPFGKMNRETKKQTPLRVSVFFVIPIILL